LIIKANYAPPIELQLEALEREGKKSYQLVKINSLLANSQLRSSELASSKGRKKGNTVTWLQHLILFSVPPVKYN